MAYKDSSFSTAISLRSYLNDKIVEQTEGEETTGAALYLKNNDNTWKQLADVQLVYVGSSFYVSYIENGATYMIPFEGNIWRVGEETATQVETGS